MEINLNRYNISDIDKSNYLCQTLESLSEKHQFNRIIISIAIFNILNLSHSFNAPTTKDDKEENDGIYFVGTLGDIRCYADLYSPPNLLIIRCDKQMYRDNKLKSILDNIDVINEIEIKVNY